ncbi:glycosyl hydrolase [Niastella yeongjuensis]|uniref:Glycosyl hydrolase n=1 Tax=Niastella yeongjuensis TaxID=354355 RepID=A0A1V9E9C3_9BACT|nr:Gfo/Idh/MocA family oxidoreductase [Niastella yeongjuensis]OQP42727.1 glycosyl hydrolase [Niastella yeongjuensis]SEO51525.1 Predicted dehydrogenase [Niastella yeongjuensis]
MSKPIERRHFIKSVALTSAGMFLMPGVKAGMIKEKLRLGVIGVGQRGELHLNLLLLRDDVEVPAICDIDEDMVNKALALCKKLNKPAPQVYSKGEYAYRDLLARKDIDAVFIATPWEWHAPMAIDAMNAGKHVACEVIMGITLQDHWDVVKTSEKTGMQYMMLENVCYRRDIMAILNMVRQGAFGELVHLEGGYQHDLRAARFNNGKQPDGGGLLYGKEAYSRARWRTEHSIKRNGDLYPTHGIGPISKMVNNQFGNRFVTLSSFASKSRGLHEYVVDNGGKDLPVGKINFNLGDVVTTIIKTNNGESIVLSHDTSLPRPYSCGFRVQGTKGLWMDINNGIYIDGKSPKLHEWEQADEYLKQYDHELYKKHGTEAAKSGRGHGGMDYFVQNAFIESIKRGVRVPIDVYESASLSAVVPLSELSIEKGGYPVEFPDFSNGKWMTGIDTFGYNSDY